MNTNSVHFFNNTEIDRTPEDCELILAVWEISNPGNLGNIIRLAHNIGALKVLFMNDSPEFSKLKIKKTAGFSYDQMSWEFISQADFLQMIDSNRELVILETCNDARNIYRINLPKKAIILAGNESHGLPKEIIKKADHKIFIPMQGGCKSMNVSHAMAVAGFEWYRQISSPI